jgi:hypothetical protein
LCPEYVRRIFFKLEDIVADAAPMVARTDGGRHGRLQALEKRARKAGRSMIKSELVQRIAGQNPYLHQREVEDRVDDRLDPRRKFSGPFPFSRCSVPIPLQGGKAALRHKVPEPPARSLRRNDRGGVRGRGVPIAEVTDREIET